MGQTKTVCCLGLVAFALVGNPGEAYLRNMQQQAISNNKHFKSVTITARAWLTPACWLRCRTAAKRLAAVCQDVCYLQLLHALVECQLVCLSCLKSLQLHHQLRTGLCLSCLGCRDLRQCCCVDQVGSLVDTKAVVHGRGCRAAPGVGSLAAPTTAGNSIPLWMLAEAAVAVHARTSLVVQPRCTLQPQQAGAIGLKRHDMMVR